MLVKIANGGNIKYSFSSAVSRAAALKTLSLSRSLLDQLNVYRPSQKGYALKSSLFLWLPKDNRYCIRK
jgi:hypothetical protein